MFRIPCPKSYGMIFLGTSTIPPCTPYTNLFPLYWKSIIPAPTPDRLVHLESSLASHLPPASAPPAGVL